MEEAVSLWEDMMVPCELLEQRRVSDGEGGFATVWAPSAPFEAAIVHDDSTQARIAEKEGVTSLYTVTTDRNANLEYHDVFKRLSDNKIFRVTSDGDDKLTPGVASFSLEAITTADLPCRWQ